MSKTSILKDELIERLINIDEEISLIYKGTIDFVIVGGSALILNFGSSRGTPDIDVLNINKDIESIVEKYDMNARSGIFETKFPYFYEDRLVEYKDKRLKVCKIYTPSLEDLIVSKIAAFRPKDQEDINSPAIVKQVNWKRLIKIVEIDKEFEQAWRSDREFSEFYQHYKEYKDRHCKKWIK